jgi:formimidoylglutamase
LQSNSPNPDIAVFGVPAHKTSISKTGAHKTPAAIRKALLRYSTYNATRRLDIAALKANDLGDVKSPDSLEGEQRTSVMASVAAKSRLAVALGGDNSITFAVARGVFGSDISNAGLITLDAHHDLRDGISNGSPVRRLIEAGLNPKRIVQIGIADFSNSPAYAQRAQELGIRVIARSELRRRSIEEIWAEAISIAGAGGAGIHVDFDMDVCDRSVVPACPAAAPGGISADELRQFAYLAGFSSMVKSLDITEVDATADAADGRTVRLSALVLLEAAAGLASR